MQIEYMCRFCGKKELKGEKMGRPMPSKCQRRKGDMPHSWVINRKIK